MKVQILGNVPGHPVMPPLCPGCAHLVPAISLAWEKTLGCPTQQGARPASPLVAVLCSRLCCRNKRPLVWAGTAAVELLAGIQLLAEPYAACPGSLYKAVVVMLQNSCLHQAMRTRESLFNTSLCQAAFSLCLSSQSGGRTYWRGELDA